MNFKKILEGIRERKVEPPVFLIRAETHLIAFCADQPDRIIESEKTAAQILGIEFQSGPMTAIVFRDDSNEFGIDAVYFMGDLRKELLPIMTDVDALKKFVEEHKDKLSPGSQLTRQYTQKVREKKNTSIGFGIAEHKMAA